MEDRVSGDVGVRGPGAQQFLPLAGTQQGRQQVVPANIVIQGSKQGGTVATLNIQ